MSIIQQFEQALTPEFYEQHKEHLDRLSNELTALHFFNYINQREKGEVSGRENDA